MDKDVKIEVGKILLALRKSRGHSQADVAEYLGITTAAYQNYEAGRREANYSNIHKLADFYGVTTDFLLGREQPDQPPIDQLEKQFNMSVLEKRIINNYLSLPKELRSDLMDFLQKSLKEATDTENAN